MVAIKVIALFEPFVKRKKTAGISVIKTFSLVL
jgi:hypothetical protein